jgi:predicted acylesterase/phospholipase RssA
MRHRNLWSLAAVAMASAYTLALPALSEDRQAPLVLSGLSDKSQSRLAFPVLTEEKKSTPANSSLANPSIGSEPSNRDASEISPPPTISVEGKETFTEKRPRLVLALSGGAIKSVAEIGVLRSLEQHHIKIDGIVGTSMGATIGALYCAGVSVDDLEAMFLDRTVQSAALKGLVWGAITKPVAPLTYVFKGKPYAGLTDGKGYLKFLEKNLPSSFDQLKIPFAAVVTNISDGQTSVLAHGDLPKAVLASSCVPTLYRPVKIDGKLYVDGGLKANLPSSIAQDMGADIVVAVLVDTAVKPEINKKFKSKKELVLRVMNIMMASADKMQARTSDVLIYPNVDFMPWITKDPDMLKRGITAGQEAGDAAAAQIQTQLAAVTQHKNTKTVSSIGAGVEVSK